MQKKSGGINKSCAFHENPANDDNMKFSDTICCLSKALGFDEQRFEYCSNKIDI